MSVDRVYPTGMGLRPKACPRPRKVTSTATRSGEIHVDRCLTLVRALTPEVPDNSGVESCALSNAPVDVQNSLTSLLIWRKLDFLVKNSFNGHQPLQFVQTFDLSCL